MKSCLCRAWLNVLLACTGYSRHLRATWIPLLPHETCKASFVYGTKSIGDGMFCAGMLEGGVDSCQGDSGGALVCLINGMTLFLGLLSSAIVCRLSRCCVLHAKAVCGAPVRKARHREPG